MKCSLATPEATQENSFVDAPQETLRSKILNELNTKVRTLVSQLHTNRDEMEDINDDLSAARSQIRKTIFEDIKCFIRIYLRQPKRNLRKAN